MTPATQNYIIATPEVIIHKIGQELSYQIEEICHVDCIRMADYKLTGEDHDSVAYILDGVYEHEDLDAALAQYGRYPHYRDECSVLRKLIEICKENAEC